MGSAMKFMLVACLIVAVTQLQFTAASYSYAARAAAEEPEPESEHKNASNVVDKTKIHKLADKFQRGYRSVSKEGEKDEPTWKPNTDPQHFHYKLTDNIKGADQFREEKINNGEVEGYWAVPVDETGKMFRRTQYRAGKDGFHIVSEKLVPIEELGGAQTNKDEATVSIDQLGGKTDYTVKGSDLKKTKEQQQQPIKRSYNYNY